MSRYVVHLIAQPSGDEGYLARSRMVPLRVATRYVHPSNATQALARFLARCAAFKGQIIDARKAKC